MWREARGIELQYRRHASLLAMPAIRMEHQAFKKEVLEKMIVTDKMGVHLEQSNASDLLVARAAWVSNYGEDARQKDGDRIEGLITFLYKNKHMSPFEHGDFTFFIDVPIFVAREFMRHRTFRFNEVSGRYSKLSPKFYVPNESRPVLQQGKIGSYSFTNGTSNQYELMKDEHTDAYDTAWACYEQMIEAGIANEVARNVLPVGIYTQFYASVSPRNLMHFLGLRNAPEALEEIRVVAEAMELILEAQMPITYSAYKENQ